MRAARWVFRVEIWSVVLIAVATVATAWSAYQAHRWSGVQAVNFGLANTARTESVRASNQAAQHVAIDVGVFTDWVTATASGDERLAGFLRGRMRDEFVPAFEAWLASAPDGEVPPGTPFELPEYRLAQRDESKRLAGEAAAALSGAKDANQNSDNFVLVSVLFASVLFCAGMGTRFRRVGPEIALLGAGTVLLVVAMAVEFALPQNVGI